MTVVDIVWIIILFLNIGAVLGASLVLYRHAYKERRSAYILKFKLDLRDRRIEELEDERLALQKTVDLLSGWRDVQGIPRARADKGPGKP